MRKRQLIQKRVLSAVHTFSFVPGSGAESKICSTHSLQASKARLGVHFNRPLGGNSITTAPESEPLSSAIFTICSDESDADDDPVADFARNEVSNRKEAAAPDWNTMP
jgi:hypothetical protein